VFTYVNSFRQPFPGTNPDALHRVFRVTEDYPYGTLSYADVADLSLVESSALIGTAAESGGFAASVRHPHMTEVAFGQAVSGSYFSVLGVEMSAGRGLIPEDDRREAPAAVVLSHAYWQRRYDGDPGAVGETILLNNNPYQIVGVAGPRFLGSTSALRPDVWMPLEQFGIVYWARSDAATNRNQPGIQLFARLAGGAEVGRALAELQAIASGLDETAPLQEGTRNLTLLPATWIHPSARQAEQSTTRIMLAAAVGLLLLACANVANLLLSAGATRRREMALRAAMGAPRDRLLRQLLFEHLMLALIAGFLAFLLANPLASRIGSYFARPSVWGANVPREVAVDLKVMLFALGVSIATGLLAGAIPALRGSRRNLVESLKEGGPWASGGRRASILGGALSGRSLLVSVQVALAVILLVVSGLTLRTLESAASLDPGFDLHHTVASFMSTSSSGVSVEERATFYRQLTQRFEEKVWVRSATVAAQAPLSPHPTQELRVEGRDEPGLVVTARVAPGFFETMGMNLAEGRAFSLGDTLTARDVVVVNRAMAQRLFGEGTILGRQVWLPGGEEQEDRGFEVVGVVEDAKIQDFLADPEPVVYFSYPQHYWTPGNALLLSTHIDPRQAVPLLEAELRAVDPTLALVNALPYSEVARGFRYTQRMNAELFTLVATMGLVLAAAGLFAVLSLAVGRRIREIGIRLSLGANSTRIVGLVAQEVAGAVSLGVLVGLASSFVVGRMMQSMLFGVGPADPIAVTGGALVLLGVAALAGFLPTRRALVVDPARTLREE
jgi:predicted permease